MRVFLTKIVNPKAPSVTKITKKIIRLKERPQSKETHNKITREIERNSIASNIFRGALIFIRKDKKHKKNKEGIIKIEITFLFRLQIWYFENFLEAYIVLIEYILLLAIVFFIMRSSPYILLASLVFFSLRVRVFVLTKFTNSWLSYILVLLVLGGVLILYSYVVCSFNYTKEGYPLEKLALFFLLFFYAEKNISSFESEAIYIVLVEIKRGLVYLVLFCYIMIGFFLMTGILSKADFFNRKL